MSIIISSPPFGASSLPLLKHSKLFEKNFFSFGYNKNYIFNNM